MLKKQTNLFSFRYQTRSLTSLSLFCCFLWFLYLFFPINTLKAQAKTDSLVTYQITQKPFGEVLEELYDNYGIRVAFNASDPVFSKKIDFAADAISITDLLDRLLGSEGYTYRKIGDQYNVYRLQQPDETETPIEEKLYEPIAVLDTVFIQKPVLKTDTLILRDTIRQTDTLVIRDTIRIFTEKPNDGRRAKIKDIRADIFNQDARRNNGQGLEVFYGRAYLWSDFKSSNAESDQLASLWNDALKPSFRSQNIGIRWYKNSNKWFFAAGLTYYDFAQSFKHDRIVSTGGFYELDTLDSYYSISGNDTSWVHVLDSVYVPLESSKSSYETINRLGMLQLGVDIGYRIAQIPGVGFYGKTGVGVSTFLYKKGYGFSRENDYEVIDLKELGFSPIIFDFRLGVLAKMRISDELDLVPELNWRLQLNNMFDDYPIQAKPTSIGINIGLIYYL